MDLIQWLDIWCNLFVYW